MRKTMVLILAAVILVGCTTDERYEGKALTEDGFVIDEVIDKEFVPECVQVERKIWNDTMGPDTAWIKTYCLEE